MKGSTPLESCNDDHHNDTSLELTPNVATAHEQQVRQERANDAAIKKQLIRLRQQREDDAAIRTQQSINKNNDVPKKQKGKPKRLRQKRLDDASIRRQQPSNNNNNESRTMANTATTTSSVEVRAIAVNDSDRDDDSLTNNDYQSNSIEMYSSSSSSSHLQSSCDSNAQLPTAHPVDIDTLQAQYKLPSRDSVLQRMKAELTTADEIVPPNNNIRSNSKFRIVVVTFVVLLVFIIAAVVIMSTTKSQRMDKIMFAPTTSPTLSNFINLQEQMKSISGDAVFDESSPQYKALSWMTFEDSFMIDILTQRDYNDDLLVRYILAVVYFSTGGPNWLNDLNFLTNSSVCDWNDHHNNNNEVENRFVQNRLSNGVHCDNIGVTKILLDRNHLNGTIPFEIGTTLKYVDEISISNNNLNGTIPSSFGTIFRLQFLDVSSNALSGTIPTSFTHLTKLEYFSTKDNYLTGTIPSAITNLVSLERLDLSVNQLTGSIPEFSFQNSFEYFSLTNNLLDGPIPESLIQLSNLEVINLANNFLNGTLPSRLGMLENLAVLYLFQNDISGSLPISIGNLDEITTLALDYNSLIGSIPSEIGKLTNLYKVNLDNNNLSGTIPMELGQCTNIYRLDLKNNPELGGTLPLSFSTMHRLELLFLQGTNLTGTFDTLICPNKVFVSADCGGLYPKVNCTCCFECCDPISGICNIDERKRCDILEYNAATLYGHKAECTCADSGRASSCIALEDCPSCNEDNTICGTINEIAYYQRASHFSLTYHNLFQYNVGRNETIIWDETPEVDCNVSINGQQCNECSVYYCRDGFPARYIDCTNIVDVVDGGIYETCQHYKTGGVLEYISWWDKFSWTGCLPFFYRPRQRLSFYVNWVR